MGILFYVFGDHYICQRRVPCEGLMVDQRVPFEILAAVDRHQTVHVCPRYFSGVIALADAIHKHRTLQHLALDSCAVWRLNL